MDKPTLVLGASSNPERYSFKATVKLKKYGHTVFPVGIASGTIEGEEILTNKPLLKNIDTVSLYVGPKNQTDWIEYIYQINPKRILFNPGTENQDFFIEAQSKGIHCEEACTLVLLGLNSY